VDGERNAVSLTNTLGVNFGTGTWVNGVYFNSALFNFARNDSGPKCGATTTHPGVDAGAARCAGTDRIVGERVPPAEPRRGPERSLPAGGPPTGCAI
jgi:hypothetical protein